MDKTMLKDMLPFQYKYRMRVRVSRVWRPRKYNSDDYDGLHYIFVDENGDCIHAYINENQHDDMTEKVELGQVYDIFRFSTKDNNFRSIKIINRDIDIQLNGATAFVRVKQPDLQIPQHPYQFIELEDLEEERKNQKTYTDIYGCIKTVKASHEQPVSNKKRVETICEITVQNLRRRIINITLWGDNARAFDIQHDDMTEKVELGQVYDIFRFSTKDNNFRSIKIINRDIDIQLNGATAFVRVKQPDLQIPQHPYQFIELEDLEEERKNQKTYTDIYGCIKTVKASHEQPVSNKKRVETICEITVQNLRRRIINITLWGDNARAFDIQTVNRSSTAVLALFTTLRLGEYRNRITASSTNHTCIFLNPIVAETEAYKMEFSREGDKVEISGLIPNNDSSDQVGGKDHKTVSELNALNPQEYKNRTVTCNASIRRFPPRTGWWYRSCSTSQCYKQLSKEENKNNEYFCTLHGLQKPRPSYRVCMTIEDRDSQATLTLMGRQAEQLFNSSCSDLVNKRFYPTEQTLPEEIVDKEGEAYHFEIKVNANHELVVRGLTPNTESVNTHASTRPAANVSGTVHGHQLTSGSKNKNKREAETETASSSNSQQQRKTEMD